MMYAVIMAGGSGTRFWPLSREKNPKQLLKLTGEVTLIQETVNRILPIINHENIFIVTVEAQKKKILALIPDLPKENILAEPSGKNTAPAIGLAAVHIKKRDPDGVMVVMPSDHIIKNQKRFLITLSFAEKIAIKEGRLVTLGMKPTYPETGYGYIQSGKELKCGKSKNVFEIAKFTEKPNLANAKKFVQRDDYHWNAGIFIGKAESFLQEIKTFMPSLSEGLESIYKSIGTKSEKSVLVKTYNGFTKVSIDVGVMEKTKIGAVIPCEVGWNDVGSWLALSEVVNQDKDGNSVIGDFVNLGSKGCIVHSADKLVAAIGLEDLVIVTTPDAILVCPKNRSQEVKEMVELLKNRGFSKHT